MSHGNNTVALHVSARAVPTVDKKNKGDPMETLETPTMCFRGIESASTYQVTQAVTPVYHGSPRSEGWHNHG